MFVDKVFMVRVTLEGTDLTPMPTRATMESVLDNSTVREALFEALAGYDLDAISLTIVEGA